MSLMTVWPHRRPWCCPTRPACALICASHVHRDVDVRVEFVDRRTRSNGRALFTPGAVPTTGVGYMDVWSLELRMYPATQYPDRAVTCVPCSCLPCWCMRMHMLRCMLSRGPVRSSASYRNDSSVDTAVRAVRRAPPSCHSTTFDSCDRHTCGTPPHREWRSFL